MGERVYNFDAMFAAMCIMEEITAPQMDNKPWEETHENHGVCQLRHWVVEELAEACDAAWTRAYRRYEVAYGIWRQRREEHEAQGQPFFDDAPDDPRSFDYDFVPFWLRNCVDWSGDQPRVRGSAQS